MKQYYRIKGQYPDAILLFRVGDFYETFGDDAVRTAEILGIALTKRANGAAQEVPLSGFPHHALDAYLPKLVRAGQRVAVCDQLEEPQKGKKVVRRGVTEMVTPGTALNEKNLEHASNNYLAAITFGKQHHGLALVDLSTGEFFLTEGPQDYIDRTLQSFTPSEVILSKRRRDEFVEHFGRGYYLYPLEDYLFEYDFGSEKLRQHFKTSHFKGFGIDDLPEGIAAAGVVLHYLGLNKHEHLDHLASLRRLAPEQHVAMDRFTIRNLELLQTAQPDGTSLRDVLDQTTTPMGTRLLSKWLVMPLKKLRSIQERLDTVDFFFQKPDWSSELVPLLRSMGDLERLIAKVSLGRANPREVGHLGRALESIGMMRNQLLEAEFEPVRRLGEQLSPCAHILERIRRELVADPPVQLAKGGVIADGVHQQLDELRRLALHGEDYLREMQDRESAETGISSLKVAYNNVFGYYLEVTHKHRDKVPAHWVRKQTLVNAERYITDELKQWEEKILRAKDDLQQLEQQLFQDLVHALNEYVPPIQQNARLLARLDVMIGFAELARVRRYVKPEVNQSHLLALENCRHPVIEQCLPEGESYVPNSLQLDKDTRQLLMVTGPNMSGKSALLRQTALAVLMAQVGCFVPAESAQIGLVDKIFTRVGASDNLSAGESTFMVEMTEAASILNNLSDRSLVLLDEIGRGTSTYDGVSIAWAMAEYLHHHPQRPKTLFATHYHELNEMAERMERIQNVHVSVKEVQGKMVFLRKLQEGGAAHSFGVEVARMAGMPQPVVNRATEILAQLEAQRQEPGHHEPKVPPAMQLQLFGQEEDPRARKVIEELQKLDLNALTPIEALMKLNYLQSLMKEE